MIYLENNCQLCTLRNILLLNSQLHQYNSNGSISPDKKYQKDWGKWAENGFVEMYSLEETLALSSPCLFYCFPLTCFMITEKTVQFADPSRKMPYHWHELWLYPLDTGLYVEPERGWLGRCVGHVRL